MKIKRKSLILRKISLADLILNHDLGGDGGGGSLRPGLDSFYGLKEADYLINKIKEKSVEDEAKEGRHHGDNLE